MIGLGTANLASGIFQGFAVSTSGSRTAVAEQSGAKSQVTGLVGAGTVVALLLSLVATLGVVFFGVLQGILIAIALSILLFFRRSWWPHGAVLGRSPDGTWHAITTDAEAQQTPRILVFRWEAPLFFANAGMFREQVESLVRQRGDRWIVLQCEAVTDIDVTAAALLEQADTRFNERGVHLAFVELRSRLRDLILRYGLLDTLDKDHFYGSLDEALAEIARIGAGMTYDDQPRPGVL